MDGIAFNYPLTCLVCLYVRHAITNQDNHETFLFNRLYFSNLAFRLFIAIYQKLNVGIRFVAFDIEDHEQCHYDYLQVFNGPNVDSPSLGKFCGKKIPSDIRSNSSYLTLKFRSDASISKPGFYVSFFAGKIIK